MARRAQLLAGTALFALVLAGCTAGETWLPDALSGGSLDGRWAELGTSPGVATLVIDGDGWRVDPSEDSAATGTCGVIAGTWESLEEGRPASPAATSIPKECAGFTLGSWAQRTRLAGFDGNVLVLLDDEGEEIGRLASVPPSVVDWDASELVGAWSITYPEAFVGSTIVLDARIFTLHLPCGELQGDWATLDGEFVAILWGSGGCAIEEAQAPWLFSATSLERDGDAWRLLDSSGGILATLAAHPDWPPPLYETFPVEQQRAMLASPVALPSTLDPRSIVGEWASLGSGRGSTVEFYADGTWRGTDDCNDGLGRWKALRDGRLLLVAPSISHAVYCGIHPVEEWIGSVKLAGFDGSELVMLDNAGNELDRLVPAT